MKDLRPIEVRTTEFQTALTKICRLYRIEVIPTLANTVGAIIAQIRLIDMNNPEMMQKYGLKEVPGPDDDDTPLNPTRN